MWEKWTKLNVVQFDFDQRLQMAIGKRNAGRSLTQQFVDFSNEFGDWAVATYTTLEGIQFATVLTEIYVRALCVHVVLFCCPLSVG